MPFFIWLIIYAISIVLCGGHVLAYYSKYGGNYGSHPIKEDLLWVVLPISNTLYGLTLWIFYFPFKSKAKRYNIDEHRSSLLLIYNSQLVGLQLSENEDGFARPFQNYLLKEAIRKIDCGVHPNKVENWVVRMEKTWRKL